MLHWCGSILRAEIVPSSLLSTCSGNNKLLLPEQKATSHHHLDDTSYSLKGEQMPALLEFWLSTLVNNILVRGKLRQTDDLWWL